MKHDSDLLIKRQCRCQDLHCFRKEWDFKLLTLKFSYLVSYLAV